MAARPPNWGDQVYEGPFSRTTLRLAATGRAVLLVGAALLVVWVTPTIDDSYDCSSRWAELVAVLGFLALVAGFTIGVANLNRVVKYRSWSVVFAAVALLLCGIATVYLYTRTGGSYRCEPS